MDALDAEIDPVTLEVVKHKLWAVPEEQAITLKAVSGSPIVIKTFPSEVQWRTEWPPSSVQYRVSSGPTVTPCGLVKRPSPHARRNLPSRSKTIIGWSPLLKTYTRSPESTATEVASSQE